MASHQVDELLRRLGKLRLRMGVRVRDVECGSATRATRAGSATDARLARIAVWYARLALGAAFLSGVAARFGLWGAHSDWKSFADFTRYTAEVNSFMPAFTIPFLAWAATAAELGLGLALVLGLWPRLAALGSALLLGLFGTAMAISFGIKSPLDYSVFAASGAALLLALQPSGTRP